MTEGQVQILEQEYENAQNLAKDLEIDWDHAEELSELLDLKHVILLKTGVSSRIAIMNCWTLIHLRETIKSSERGLFTNHFVTYTTFLLFSQYFY